MNTAAKIALSAAAALVSAVSTATAESRYLFVWAGDEDGDHSDFVAVVDARSEAATYGEIVATLPVGMASGAHHVEHQMGQDGRLFVNGFSAGTTYIVDLADPHSPRLVSSFEARADLDHLHSMERLANGNLLATFQNAGGLPDTTGGVAELTSSGDVVRWASAADAEHPTIRPYSLAPVPDLDRLVTTSTDMRGRVRNDTVQLWRLSDLKLLATVRLPRGPRGREHLHPVEPRVLADGETVMVTTFGCGLHRTSGLATSTPEVSLVYVFQSSRADGIDGPNATFCAVPVVARDLWIQSVPARDGLVALDLSGEGRPREVGSVILGAEHFPHWMSLEPSGERIVVTGYGELARKVMMVTIDPTSGRLAIDRRFGDGGAVSFDRESWSHGVSGAAVPHGTVFSAAP